MNLYVGLHPKSGALEEVCALAIHTVCARSRPLRGNDCLLIIAAKCTRLTPGEQIQRDFQQSQWGEGVRCQVGIQNLKRLFSEPELQSQTHTPESVVVGHKLV